jgi:hypothetical protein
LRDEIGFGNFGGRRERKNINENYFYLERDIMRRYRFILVIELYSIRCN